MRSRVAAVAIVVVLDMIGDVRAEGGCPTGMIPSRSESVAACGPIPASGDTWAAEPQWADRWGAIASDSGHAVMGTVAERSSKRAAEREALAACRALGGVGCAVELAYRNRCVATIRGTTGVDHVGAVSSARAADLGMARCRKRGDGDCRLHYRACSFPVRVR